MNGFTLIIDECIFENITNFISLFHCIDNSYCNIIIRNSIFINNIIQDTCYEPLSSPAYSGIYLTSQSYGTANFTNNTLYYDPIIAYDESTSNVYFDSSNKIIDSSSTSVCNNSMISLYLSSETGNNNGGSNDCTNSNTPCRTWSYVINEFTTAVDYQPNVVLNILGGGSYSISNGLTINEINGYVWISQNYTYQINGNSDGSSNSVLKPDSSINQEIDIEISNLHYFPQNYESGRFLYVDTTNNIQLSNILLNGTYISSSGESDEMDEIIYITNVNNIIITNIHITDFDCKDYYADYIFYISNIQNQFQLSNIQYYY